MPKKNLLDIAPAKGNPYENNSVSATLPSGIVLYMHARFTSGIKNGAAAGLYPLHSWGHGQAPLLPHSAGSTSDAGYLAPTYLRRTEKTGAL